MKLSVIIILSLLLSAGCRAQTQLPAEMPAEITVYLNISGAMMRSYKKITIGDGVLSVEEATGNRQNPQKWSAKISRADLAKLYKKFVENEFDLIKNDEREGIFYDAGSESISISLDKPKSFNVTYGKNSPLSGSNLARYQAVRKAIDDLIAKNQPANQTTNEY